MVHGQLTARYTVTDSLSEISVIGQCNILKLDCNPFATASGIMGG